MVQSIKSGRKSRTTVVALAVSAAVVAGVLAVLMLAFTSSASSNASGNTPHSATQPAAANTTNAGSGNTAGPVPHEPTLPASQVKTIQQQLAQLNYYEGPIDGVMNSQTVQAITYLQRDSQLPQNGEWDQVTYLAMQRMLATGNNQMGG